MLSRDTDSSLLTGETDLIMIIALDLPATRKCSKHITPDNLAAS